ncbi:hypothetical protein pb186bvf_015069 [Paramecium bursaria]
MKASISQDSEQSPRKRNEESIDKRSSEIVMELQRQLLERNHNQVPIHQFFCCCEVCKENKLELKPLKGLDISLTGRGFVFLLDKLLPHSRYQRTLQINIPDTICFDQGQFKFVIFNQRERSKNQIKAIIKEMNSFNQIRNFVVNRRKKLGDYLPKEAFIVKFQTNRYQIISEYEFSNLMVKNKNDKFWNEIQYFQSHLKMKNNSIQKIYFNRQKEEMQPLFKRAQIEPLILVNYINRGSQDFISSDDEDIFQKQLPNIQLLNYLVFKICWYSEILHGVKILQGLFEWQRDDSNEIFLINAENIESMKVEEILEITEERYYQDLDYQTQKKLSLKDYHHKYLNKSNDEYENLMMKSYHQVQQKVGISNDYFKIEVDTRSDQVYDVFHPNSKYKFKDIMSKTDVFKSMQKKMFKPRNHQVFLQSKMMSSFFLNTPKRKPKPKAKDDLIGELNKSKLRLSRTADKTQTDFRKSRYSSGSYSNKKTLSVILDLRRF